MARVRKVPTDKVAEIAFVPLKCEYYLDESATCDRQAVTEWIDGEGHRTRRCARHNHSKAIRWAAMNGWKMRPLDV